MSNVPLFVDHIRNLVVTTPLFVEKGFTLKTFYRRLLPQVKMETVKYPVMTLVYDIDGREKWAPIDAIKFFITLHMDNFEDMTPVIDALSDLLHMYTAVDGCLTIYKVWAEGGPPAPMLDEKTNKWMATVEFSASIA